MQKKKNNLRYVRMYHNHIQEMYKHCASINKDNFALYNLHFFSKAMPCDKQEYLICNDYFKPFSGEFK